jgi:uncharacterized protein (TIGR03083 family)
VTSTERPPPAALRDRVLDASWQARPAGKTVPEVQDISPVEAFSRAADALYQTLRSLPEDAWRRPAIRGLDVQGLVGHLTGVEHDVQRAISGDQAVGQAEHVASTQAAAHRQAGRSPAQTLGEWRRAVRRTLTLVTAAGDLAVVIGLHGVQLPLYAVLVGRAFELWTHENDIREKTGLPATVPDAATLTLMTRLAATLLPYAALGSGLGQPAHLHLVLTGQGGGTWDIEVGDMTLPGPAARVSIVADAVRFCRLVANRAAPAGIDADITGDHDVAAGILAAAATLALD